MAEIKDPNQLRSWLDGKDHEVVVTIASRAALRALPGISNYVSMRVEEHSSDLVLPIFRTLAVPWHAGTRWYRAQKILREAAATAAATDAAKDAHYPATDPAAYPAAANAANAANAAAAANAAYAAYTDAYPGADSAAAAAADSAAAASGAIWDEISADTDEIDAGTLPENLMRRRLWRNGAPEGSAWNWEDLKSALLALDDDWEVWTDWYDDRLRGADHLRSRPLIEALETDRILIPDEDWEKGAKHVNAIIAALEAEYRARAPEQRPAIIEVEYGDDGRLHRRPARSPQLRDDAQEQRVRAAWAAHSEQLAALEALDPGRNSPAFAAALRSYRETMGSNFDEINVIALGVHGSRLVAFSENVGEYFLEDVASEVGGLAAAHGLFVRQFPDWRDYLDDSVGEVSAEINDAAVGFARSLSNEPEIIAEDVVIAAAELAAAVDQPLIADPNDRASQILRRELLRSVGNILSGMLSPLLDSAREARSAAWKGTLKGIEKGTEGVSKRVVQAVALAGSAYVTALVTGFSVEFAWIKPVVDFLKMKLNL